MFDPSNFDEKRYFESNKLVDFYHDQFIGHTGTGNHIVVCAQPKSGSTLITQIISEITGYPVLRYSDISTNHNTFSLNMALSIKDKDAVIHVHCPPEAMFLGFLKAKGSKFIITKREFDGFVASMTRHIERGPKSKNWEKVTALSEQGDEAKVYDVVAFIWVDWVLKFQREWFYRAKFDKIHGDLVNPIRIMDHSFIFDQNTSLYDSLNPLFIEKPTNKDFTAAYESVISDEARSNFYNTPNVKNPKSHIRSEIKDLYPDLFEKWSF